MSADRCLCASKSSRRDHAPGALSSLGLLAIPLVAAACAMETPSGAASSTLGDAELAYPASDLVASHQHAPSLTPTLDASGVAAYDMSAGLDLSFTAGAIISPISATIDAGGPGFGSISDTFNQRGLTSGFTSGVTSFDAYLATTPRHTMIFSGAEWFSNFGTTGATVTYDLGAVTATDRLALWNEESSGIGTLNLLSSTDGVTFTVLASGLHPHDNPITSPVDSPPYPADVFAFTPTRARFVRFVITDSPQPDPGLFPGAGIGEVAFRVVSDLPPVARCQDVAVDADQTCSATASIDDGSFDPDGDRITCTQSPGGPLGLGSNLVTLTCTDPAGLSASCTATVTVADSSPPVFDPASLAPQTVAGRCDGAPVELTPPRALDCQHVSVTCTPVAGTSLGANASTCTATDAGGRQTAATVTVNVLAPLQIRVEPTLWDDNDPDDIETDGDSTNLFIVGDTIDNKITLHSCACQDVTTSIAGGATVRLTVRYRDDADPSSSTSIAPTSTGVGGPDGALVLKDGYLEYDQATSSMDYTPGSWGNSHYFQNVLSVTYNSTPDVVVGQEDVRLESE